MQQNHKDMIKILPTVLAQLEGVAKEMNMNNQNEREVIIKGTSVKLWLIRSGTPEARKREEKKGSILTDDSAVIADRERFFLSRR